jgi:hypothetical protein
VLVNCVEGWAHAVNEAAEQTTASSRAHPRKFMKMPFAGDLLEHKSKRMLAERDRSCFPDDLYHAITNLF